MSVTVRQAPVVNTVSITYTVSDRILVQEQFRIRPQTRRDLDIYTTSCNEFIGHRAFDSTYRRRWPRSRWRRWRHAANVTPPYSTTDVTHTRRQFRKASCSNQPPTDRYYDTPLVRSCCEATDARRSDSRLLRHRRSNNDSLMASYRASWQREIAAVAGGAIDGRAVQ